MKSRWTWTLVLVAVLATIASAAPPPPPPPANPEIVYREAGTRDKIVVMNSDGSNKTIVLTTSLVVARPVFSPDGQWIAFTVAGSGLYKLERATGVATLLFSNAQCGANCFISYARFSPTGDRVAVIASPGNFGNIYRVLAVPLTGGTPQLLYTGPANVIYSDAPAWSTDETRIALLQRQSGQPNRIHVVVLQAQTVRTIVEASAGTSFFRIDWARTNVDRIAFDVGDVSQTSIYTVDFTPTTVSPPVLAAAGASWPSFSPDNTYIVARRKISNNKYTLSKRNLGTGVWTDLGGDQQPDWKR